MFLFQMVFMDTAATIVTGAAAERWKFAAFSISTFFLAAITYPLYGNWAWGGGWPHSSAPTTESATVIATSQAPEWFTRSEECQPWRCR